jgi:hypothetical protein
LTLKKGHLVSFTRPMSTMRRVLSAVELGTDRREAITLAHWAACDRWAAVGPADVDKRIVWLQRRGVPVNRPASIDEGVEATPTPRLGSSPYPYHAGHSHPGIALVNKFFNCLTNACHTQLECYKKP